MILLIISVKAYCVPPVLSSYPSATATIFIDFDGHTVQSTGWNGGNILFCNPAPLSDDQMIEIFNRVSEDYRPFNVNITTDSTKFRAAPLNKRIRVIVTNTSEWRPGVGGIAYINSFTWGDDTPAFVFTDRLSNSAKYIGECVSHESGHTVGLSHQSTYSSSCQLVETYSMGNGTGETSWAPVMGNSYYRNMTGWNLGPTPSGCNNYQDNLSIITSSANFSYRPDDYAQTMNSSSPTISSSSFNMNGIIATSNDKDAFKYIVSQNGAVHIEANPFRLDNSNTGANLDVQVDLYNSSNALIRSYSPIDRMNVVIDTILNAGTYYLQVSGTGNLNTGDYGSLGSYALTGIGGPLAIHDISFTGTNDKNRHSFKWNIVADEPIKSQVLEMSVNGTDFTSLTNIMAAQKDYSYVPYQKGTFFYRLKATSVIEQVAYSNIIALNSNGIADKLFSVSTLIQNEITVNSSEIFGYSVSDANGRLMKKGKGNTGVNRIDMSGFSSGMYIIQLINKNSKQTERIIKQ
ncbi:MAG: T9SS type A sorting domain-containing protein [Ferruginibacter sp.]